MHAVTGAFSTVVTARFFLAVHPNIRRQLSWLVLHQVDSCRTCGSDLSATQAEKVIKRQEFDVEIKVVVTEHQAEVKRCKCGVCTSGEFPAHIRAPVQFGEMVHSIALYLSEQFIPKDRLSEAMEREFRIRELRKAV